MSFDPAPAERLLSRLRERAHPYQVSFAGLDLRIDENVFCPRHTKTSAIMLECLDGIELPREARALDIFTGSGVFALYLAARGCRALGVDILPEAVRCAQHNAAANNLGDRASFVLGNGLSAVLDEGRFDIVTACPPLLPGRPEGPLEGALFDERLGSTHRFVSELPRVLASKGRAYLFLSDVFARVGNDIDALARDAGLVARTALAHDVGYEVYSVVELRHAG
ncbi:methyltransferase domain-containing protein [Salinarimonas ramus]|nr:methyltransferase domain-containing protein [Salinarimonas ramus]